MKTKDNKKLISAIYIRVSDIDQKKGWGLDFQLEDCKKAIIDAGMTLKEEHIFVDTVSGKNDNRPNWQELLETARRGKFNVIYFWRLDRMMRDEYFYYVNEKVLNDLGVDVYFATQDLQNPFHRAIAVAVAAEERRTIKERTKRGRDMAIKAGKWAWGLPTYGYKLNKDKGWIEIDEKQAKWVKKIFEWLVYEQCSMREIARRLNNSKVPTWTQSVKSERKVSKIWYPRTINRMVVNELYTGKTHFHKYERGKMKLKNIGDRECMRDENEWIQIEVAQIISPELHNKALKQLRKNSEFARRKKKRSYMFSGLLYCPVCGFKFRGGFSQPTSKTAKGSRNYFSFTLKRYENSSKKCKYCGVVAESRLMPIWDVLKNILSNPDMVYDKLKKYSNRDKTDDARERITFIDKELQSLVEDEKRAKVAYLDTKSIEEPEYKSRMNNIRRKHKELESEHEKANNFIISEEEKSSRIDAINLLYKRIKNNLKDASYETKDKLMHLFVNRIDLALETNKAEVEFHFSDSFLRGDPHNSSREHYGASGAYSANDRKD